MQLSELFSSYLNSMIVRLNSRNKHACGFFCCCFQDDLSDICHFCGEEEHDTNLTWVSNKCEMRCFVIKLLRMILNCYVGFLYSISSILSWNNIHFIIVLPHEILYILKR